MMNSKPNGHRPRLDRRNAIKNSDYDASVSSPSSSASSFGDQSTHRTRSLDISTLSDRSSFRIEGIDGEFDRICRSLGLSGPEDFAIPADAWEARKLRSPSDHFPTSRFRDHYNSPTHSTEDSLPEPRPRVSDEIDGANPARDRESDEIKQVGSFVNSVRVRSCKDGEGGIKGFRPPVLSPPPVMALSVVDNGSSTWDLLESFGPRDGGSSSSPNEVEEHQEVQIVAKEEPSVAGLRNTAVLSESCSDTSNEDDDDDDNEDDPIRTAVEYGHSISPSRRFIQGIMSWQKGDFIGSGSFGTVYEGFTDDGFFFAVKEVSLLDQGSQGKQSIYQLEQEISLLSKFKHKNIVQYLGTDTDNGKLYIFLELVTKGSLASLYQKYRLRDSQVSAYTRQILNGLNYLHRRKVIHRDIKCANILVDASGSVKLADFGLAKATKLNDVKSCKGTAFWMAPEVVKRQNHGYGLAADIWSLGCTVLEMLTGQVPYSHLEGMQALFKIGKGEPPPIPDSLSGDAQDFILKCLQVNPDRRPTAVQLLDHPFLKRPLSNLSAPGSPSPHYNRIRS